MTPSLRDRTRRALAKQRLGIMTRGRTWLVVRDEPFALARLEIEVVGKYDSLAELASAYGVA